MNQSKNHIRFLVFIPALLLGFTYYAQEVPSLKENIPYMVTFGLNSDTSLGDDDFSQTVFFAVPKQHLAPVYVRIFDPETFGGLDEIKEGANTRMKYFVYGGKDSYSDKDARNTNPVGNYKSGTLLYSRIFGSEKETDQKWVSMGPFNPEQGEFVAELDAYVFKVIIDGMKGNDGNIYKLFLSTKNTENVAVEGGNAFVYEYSVRLQMAAYSLAHLYPYADNLVTSINISCFDFDNDGQIKLYSNVKNGHLVTTMDNNEWSHSIHPIIEEEHNKCLDLQIVKNGDFKNDMVFYITNQYNAPIPLFIKPIGELPKYKYKISVKSIVKPK